MADTMDEIIHEDDIKGAINELCEDITDFSQLDFIHITWAKKNEKAKGRYYGELETLLANLEVAKFVLLTREIEVGEET